MSECFISLLQLDGCPVGKSVGCDRISGHPRHHHDQLGLDSVVGVKAKKDNSQHLSALVPDPLDCVQIWKFEFKKLAIAFSCPKS